MGRYLQSRIRSIGRVGLIVLIVSTCLFGWSPYAAAADGEDTLVNRFNVVFVVDASGSMIRSDVNGFRFEALSQFFGLLAERGNNVGCVAFSDIIAAKADPILADGRQVKDEIISSLTSVEPSGDTNTGAALKEAVEMLVHKGDKDYPSVILFLSDGNTDMPTAKQKEESLELKAEALQEAREAGITIYSVCLNADGSADLPEMQQLAQATGGVFREVRSAGDLQDVFNAFYELIYGSSSVLLVDETFSDKGELETPFDVPAAGVEEVNVVIYGNVKSYKIINPEGAIVEPKATIGNTFLLLKLDDIASGTWRLRTSGVPGDRIRINTVYNTNLIVEASFKPENGQLNPVDSLAVNARLCEGTSPLTKAELYEGYTAVLILLDSLGKEIDRVPMSCNDDGFSATASLKDGSYACRVEVTGNGIERASELMGPIVVSKDIDSEEQRNNKSPKPVDERVEETVFIVPFQNTIYEKDLTELATDDQDEPLSYRIVSTSFLDNDYSVDGTKLTVRNFSISKGAFTVRATDKWGQSCDVELVVKSHNLGLWALIGIGVAAVIGLIVVGVGFYIALTRPFRGSVTVHSYVNGNYAGATRNKQRGRMMLSVFGLDPVGIDYSKSYVQATGKRQVILHTNVPVPYGGTQTKEIVIESGYDTRIVMPDGKQLIVRFDSRMRR